MERSDGLLRGSRQERTRAMESLAEGPWSLETLLHAHLGLLDHSEDVRLAALLALADLAEADPPAIQVRPDDVIEMMLPYFTGASCVRGLWVLRLLRKEAGPDRVLRALQTIQSNGEFADTLKLAVREGHAAALSAVDASSLSPKKQKLLASACRGPGTPACREPEEDAASPPGRDSLRPAPAGYGPPVDWTRANGGEPGC